MKTVSRPRVSKSMRLLIWDRYIGLDRGSTPCPCCGTVIYQLNFEAGHIVPFSKGGSTKVNNLMPICSLCNKSMGNKNFFVFLRELGAELPVLRMRRSYLADLGPLVGEKKSEDWEFLIVEKEEN